MKSLFVTVCAGVALCVPAGSASAESAAAHGLQCENDDAFESSSGWACRFTVTWVEANTAIPGKDVFNLPGAFVVTAFSFLPGVGYVIKNAYKDDGNRHYHATVGPPPGYEHYLHCAHHEEIHTDDHGIDYRWRHVDEKRGVYEWGLAQKGLFQGGSSFFVKLRWKAVHPELSETYRRMKICKRPQDPVH